MKLASFKNESTMKFALTNQRKTVPITSLGRGVAFAMEADSADQDLIVGMIVDVTMFPFEISKAFQPPVMNKIRGVLKDEVWIINLHTGRVFTIRDDRGVYPIDSTLHVSL